ncbi:MAG: protein translocase subunit SecD [Acidobacteria bacterium]|nr:protein translocase subunit SecD [Acidobacteriota bacterium]
MKKKLRWKIILIFAVIVLCVFLFYPPGQKIMLGLDLRGGMHLVLQVMTDDAIDNETDMEILRLQERMQKKGITFTTVVKDEERLGRFSINEFDVMKERDLRALITDEFKEWDTSFAGNRAFLTLETNIIFYLRDQAVRQAMETLRNRVDELGLSDIPIQRQGTGERIIVELPGVENPERVKNILKKTAMLEWKLVYAQAPTREELMTQIGDVIPENQEILEGDPDRGNTGYYLVSRVAVVTGKDLRSARRSVDEWNAPAISFSLNPEAGRRFEKFTGDNVGNPLSIVLDNKIQEVANIKDKIPATSGGIIHGSYSIEDAEDLALVLRAGALPATIKYLEERTIGPSLGKDSISRGFTSIVIALLLVMVFMVFYYRLAGVNAVTALIINVFILLAALAYFKANLTLPGIAGIILTIGMSVDANVLVFERIREELSTGKGVISSISTGFSRAFRTILDANVTTIIAAVFLFQFGTGPIRGFAITLIIGITASMFTAIFVSRTIFDITVSRKKKIEKLSI